MDFRLAPVAKNDVLEITDYDTAVSAVSAELAERFVAELEVTLCGHCFQPGLGSRRSAHFLPDRSLRVLHERRDLDADLISD